MYKLQIIDAFTKEILIEENHYDFQATREFLMWLDDFEESEVIDCFFADHENRTLVCEYHSYSVITYDEEIVVKAYFKRCS